MRGKVLLLRFIIFKKIFYICFLPKHENVPQKPLHKNKMYCRSSQDPLDIVNINAK